MSPDNGPPASESRDSLLPSQGSVLFRADGEWHPQPERIPRPPIEDVTSPAFEAWALERTVPVHLANALQLVELMAARLDATDCPKCWRLCIEHEAELRDQVNGIRSRLAAIALRALPRTVRAIEVPLNAFVRAQLLELVEELEHASAHRQAASEWMSQAPIFDRYADEWFRAWVAKEDSASMALAYLTCSYFRRGLL